MILHPVVVKELAHHKTCAYLWHACEYTVLVSAVAEVIMAHHKTCVYLWHACEYTVLVSAVAEVIMSTQAVT